MADAEPHMIEDPEEAVVESVDVVEGLGALDVGSSVSGQMEQL